MLKPRLSCLVFLLVPVWLVGCGSYGSSGYGNNAGSYNYANNSGGATTATGGYGGTTSSGYVGGGTSGTTTGGGTSGTTTTGGGTSGTTGTGGTTGGPSAALPELNFVRSLANLPPVVEDFTDPNFDPGCQLHAQWIVTNDLLTDQETPGSPGFTAAGQSAGAQSNSESSTSTTLTLTQAVDGLMTAPFHGIGFIDPLLTTTGFGLFSNPNLPPGVIRSAAVINVLGGRNGTVPQASAFPILWPANGQQTPYASYSGNEFPDPTSSLWFMNQPSGGVGPGILSSPVMAQFASTPAVTAFYLIRAGSGPEVVAEFDETNYVNPTASTQSAGRAILAARHAVVLMANAPLQQGGSYAASVTNHGVNTVWSFTVSATAQRIEHQGTDAFH